MPTLHQPSDQPYNNYSSGYGGREAPMPGASTNHRGIDYGWGRGWSIYAALSGTVESAYYGNGYNEGWGGRIILNHGAGVKTAYAHLNANSNIGFGPGRGVSRGQKIANIGNPSTGASTGPHLHFELYINGNRVNPYPYFTQNVPGVGGGSGGGEEITSGTQRRANSVVNRRADATSQSTIAGDPLTPGTVGNFNGWKYGENVDGNNVWFRGISGNWFWSGGFEGGANTANLENLNAPSLSPTQRQTKAVVKRRIGAPNTSAQQGEPLEANVTGNFKGWVYGETVEGNNLWYVGISGDFFWSGAFTSVSKDGLADLNAATPPTVTHKRVVKSGDSVNGRTGPGRNYPVAQSLTPGSEGEFDQVTVGENVEGINLWYRGKFEKNWFWAGAFTIVSKEGLQEVTWSGETPTTPPPTPVVKPATQQTPVLPFATEGWDVPRGRDARDAGKKENPNYNGFVSIRYLAIHHTGSTAKQDNYFKGAGEGSVPTWYVDAKRIIEFTRPGLRPVTTADNNNWSVSIETQNTTGENSWEVAAESIENIAQIAAWLASYDGKKLDGIAVDFKLDRKHIMGHKEFPGNNTSCPGPYLYPLLNKIVERAKVIYAEKYEVKPEPVDPPTEEIPVVTPPTAGTPEGYVLVKKTVLNNMSTELEALKIVTDELAKG